MTPSTDTEQQQTEAADKLPKLHILVPCLNNSMFPYGNVK